MFKRFCYVIALVLFTLFMFYIGTRIADYLLKLRCENMDIQEFFDSVECQERLIKENSDE